MVSVQSGEGGKGGVRVYIYVDERSRHWISVSGTYGRSKRGMKWDTRHYKAQEYGYGTYRVGGGGYRGEENTMGIWLWNIGMGLARGTRQWEFDISSK